MCFCRSLILVALFFCSQGVIQNFEPYTVAKTMEGAQSRSSRRAQSLHKKPSRCLGTNGGGFFNGANSAHPFENPTPLDQYGPDDPDLPVIPAGLTYTFGVMVGDRKQGWAIFAACSVMFLAGAFCLLLGGTAWQSRLSTKLGMEASAGNFEGKEQRFGIAAYGLVCNRHYRRQLRRRERDAR